MELILNMLAEATQISEREPSYHLKKIDILRIKEVKSQVIL